MRLFTCRVCGQLIFFENTRCERCAHRLGYDPALADLLPVDPKPDAGSELWTTPRGIYRFCANAALDACNWLVEAGSKAKFCAACRHNVTIPDLSLAQNLARWRVLEVAKHRLIYSLQRLGLRLETQTEKPGVGLGFAFLAELPAQGKVLTGYDAGLITIALPEADEVELTRRRSRLGELYRTPLGHFRHESGHHYWQTMVAGGGRLEDFRALFGDERADYAQALATYYANPPPANWRDQFVSAYATSHPWEDFAESWAHYLHMMDALETASALGLAIQPGVTDDPSLRAKIDFDLYGSADLTPILQAWGPLVVAANCLNRAMGQPDFYPFVLSPGAIEKIGFIHNLVRAPSVI